MSTRWREVRISPFACLCSLRYVDWRASAFKILLSAYSAEVLEWRAEIRARNVRWACLSCAALCWHSIRSSFVALRRFRANCGLLRFVRGFRGLQSGATWGQACWLLNPHTACNQSIVSSRKSVPSPISSDAVTRGSHKGRGPSGILPVGDQP